MKKLYLIVLGIFCCTTVNAKLDFNLKRSGLELSSTKTFHQQTYSNNPVSQLGSDSQELIKGIFDSILEYSFDDFKWDNSFFTEYGKTKLKPAAKPETINENADKIQFSSDLAYKLYKMDTVSFGPFAKLQYQTEWTPNNENPRMQAMRGMSGIKLFDGVVVKDLYIAGVYEYDWTFEYNRIQKFAGEAGWRLEYELKQDIKISTEGYYRRYFDWSAYLGSDLVYDFSAIARMDVNLWNNLTMGPYAQYRRVEARETDLYGGNFIIGLSFAYKNLWNL